MRRHLVAAAALLALVGTARGADNAIVLTPGVGVTERSKDIGGGVQEIFVLPGDTAGNPLATAPGTGNTSFALPMQGVAGGVAIPISGTITANAGTNLNTSALATSALQTSGGQKTQIVDGSGNVIAPATAALQGTNTATTTHTCSVAGFSELGCLGQIDDDVKATGSVNPGSQASWGIGPTGSPVVANSVYVGVNIGGTLTGLVTGPAPAASSLPTVQPVLNHASTTAITATSLAVKASAGNLDGFNCTGITGGAAGYCVAYNATSAPGTGALTGALVLDSCYFDTTSRGCSLAHVNGSIAFSTGIVILMTSAASPFTYTTGTDTGFISGDYD